MDKERVVELQQKYKDGSIIEEEKAEVREIIRNVIETWEEIKKVIIKVVKEAWAVIKRIVFHQEISRLLNIRYRTKKKRIKKKLDKRIWELCIN